ncbi:MAG: nucleoside triphosphate pyrophosphatase [Pseudorhodobacter sp.]|nr:nucleoside triphosphate pyrophosphatase [Pseudorhodobacter sp.]
MQTRLILASSSTTRLAMLRAAGLQVEPQSPRIDEVTIVAALVAEGASPADIADTLAEMKARKIAVRIPDSLVLGCDQVLDFQGHCWGKPETPDAARAQLRALRGKTHQLLSAVVLYHQALPIWRHTGAVRLTMRNFSEAWLEAYLARNWQSIRHSAGGYRLEEQGVQLFTAIEGDYFTVLGLPLLPLLAYLGQRGFIAT